MVFSAATSWIFAKSISNAANLGQAFGITGGIGYATYYLSFVVAVVAIYFIRVKGGFGSLASFLIAKYADDLGIKVYGLLICTSGYLLGALFLGRRSAVATPTTGA